MNGVPSAIDNVVAGQGRPHERAERFRPFAIAPAEVIENRNSRRVGADRHAIANRLVDRAGRHVVRVEIAIARIHAASDHDAAPRTEHRPQHGRIARPVVRHADKRLHHAAALHLMIVLPNDPFLAGHVRRRENLQQVVGVRTRGDFVAQRAVCWPFAPAALINRLPHHRRPPLVQKLHRQIGNACSS